MQIHVIPAARHSELWQQLLSACPGDMELQAFSWSMPAGEPPFTQMFAAYRGGQLIGAIRAREMPGKLVRVWPPYVVADGPEATADQLLAAISRHFVSQRGVSQRGVSQRGVSQRGWLIQALLPRSTGADAERLLRHGYRHVADLVVMSVSCRGAPTTCPASPLRFVAYRDGHDRALLLEILEQTYRGTLDIPQLDGLRSTDDVLTGYEQTIDPADRVWLLVYDAEQAVGCLLLADRPEQDEFELVYLGLIPAARGQAWGGQLVGHALWRAGHGGRGKLVLAVDANNKPAMQIYAAAGFAECGRHCLFLHQPESGHWTQPS